MSKIPSETQSSDLLGFLLINERSVFASRLCRNGRNGFPINDTNPNRY